MSFRVVHCGLGERRSYTLAILKWPTRKKLVNEVVKCSQNSKNTLECTDRLRCILVKSCYNLEYAREAF